MPRLENFPLFDPLYHAQWDEIDCVGEFLLLLKLLRNASEVDCECFICQDKKWQIIKIWKELQQPRSYKPLWLLIFLFTLQQLR